MHKRAIPLFLFLSAFCVSSVAADKKVLTPPGTAPNRPFSAGLQVGDTIYVSGITAGSTIPENFEEEVQKTLDNISEVLKLAGASLSDAVSVQVYLTDMSLFPRMNTVYMKNFPEPRPTRTTVGVAKLAGPAHIEITVTARKTKKGK
jgi:2-iminobutanoate/2-iminopropanoate deaminase